VGCACVQAVCRHPQVYAKGYEDYRRALVRRFPYAVFYEYSENTVTVYCVFHTARDPVKWRQALESRSQY
jgi:plasmid stabilization system protein ParE